MAHDDKGKVMLAKIEEMVAGLLPWDDGKPDIDGTGTPDIAQLVLQTRDCTDKAPIQSFFKNLSGEEGWYEIASLLAMALVTVDKEHRNIIKTIRSVRDQS